MRIGIGLPNPVPGVPGTTLVEWARRAEAAGFAQVATIDRLAYPGHDSLMSLAAAAGATSRIGLHTNILLAPLYPAVHLARSAASLDQLSGGRFSLGVGVGGREDDFVVAGLDFHRRGQILDQSLDLMHRAWRGEPLPGSENPVGPVPVRDHRVPVMVGGTSDAAIRRVTTYGAGWTMGGGSPDMAAGMVPKVEAAWRDAGREGAPRIAALAYFSLGADQEEQSRAYLRHYYGFLGDWVETIVNGALRTEDAVRGAVKAFEDAGVTELTFDPTTASLDQVERLAELVL
ncbi:MAG: LLM class flavin-dependent oxidoreductase [Nocardioidaceae bacterium]|nr:LLM class flavin-dependent oxidoreductase [Nocardioidaceae bacterium]NUS50371.1 LLM class flavin-dependent oxidoreductase [Nocardioidaceae bacterium]